MSKHSRNMVKHQLTATALESSEIVQGALYHEEDGEIYIGARIDTGQLRLISLTDGNRWSARSKVPGTFTRVPGGTALTILTGE